MGMRISSALRRILARSRTFLEPYDVVGSLFERPVGEVPRSGTADHNAGEYSDRKLLPAKHPGEEFPLAGSILRLVCGILQLPQSLVDGRYRAGYGALVRAISRSCRSSSFRSGCVSLAIAARRSASRF